MELQHSRSRIGQKNNQNVIGIPMISSSDSALMSFMGSSRQQAFLPDPAAQYQLLPSPNSNHCSKIRHSRVHSVMTKMIKLGESMDGFAQGIREHGIEIRTKAKRNGERKVEAGGKNPPAGPIAGLLFVSTNRVAFCSDRSIILSSPAGKTLKAHYKVMIPLRKIKKAAESENVKKPTQKYVQIVTDDNFEFWFMGFLNHGRTLKYLQQAIHQAR
ncbi:UNVERIFIED_CONTAM: GEM-like protein 4 [Sesamum radiatum]|uniref:GEM-like protein 4 n=1 Tax=Sesamum radiatum TaxID=300843 RepID=A0AAW2TWD7_SESRA